VLQVDEKPSEDYSDVGGLDKQIKELVEAIVLPVTHKDKFKALGIRPPKGLLQHGRRVLAWRLQPSQYACASDVRLPHLLMLRRNIGCRCAAVWAAGHRQDLAGTCLRGADQCHVPEASRPTAGADVHWRWRKAGAPPTICGCHVLRSVPQQTGSHVV
jgi:hypothetical protein